MILHACLLAGLVAQQPPAPKPPPAPRAHVVRFRQEDCTHQEARIQWFQGSFDELLAKASETKRLAFLDLWADWCHYCKQMEKETLSDPGVAHELADVLCFSVDTGKEENAPIVERFNAHGEVPMLIFLEPDGELRDVFSGYKAPAEFIAEVRRIKRNENTVSALRKAIEKDPKNVEARYELAQKLRKIGDHGGYAREIAIIHELDPEGRTVPSRRLVLLKLRKNAEAELRLDPVYAFIQGESEANLLFEGWLEIWKLEQYMTKVARDDAERDLHRKKAFAAARALWPHVPKKDWRVGNNIAWSYWEGREYLTPADLMWALEVAETVAKEAPRNAYVIDTLACCLWAVGRRDEAIEAVRRCIELEPKNAIWKQRLAEFKHGYSVARGR